MFFQVYGAAFAFLLASVVLGRAVCAAAGGGERWRAAPAVGLGALIVLAGAAIKLPGKGVTAACVVALALAAATAFLLRSGRMQIRWGDLVILVAPLLGASLPFLANGRVGLQGIGLNNDSHSHLLWAEGLRSATMAKLWGAQNGYPLGPHSVVATFGTVTGIPLDLVFSGLLIATVGITALTAAEVLATESLWRRAVVGLLCSLPYLVASYYGEGAFKETIMAALLLAFVLHLEQVRTRWGEASAATRWRLVVPAVFLVAGAVYTYSYVALAWYAVVIVIWIVAEAISRPALLLRRMSRRGLRAAAPWLAGTAVLALIVLLPVAGQVVSFFNQLGTSPASSGAIPTGALGNLIVPLSPYEMLGIWTSPDFRIAPANGFHAGELSALALAVLIYGVVWSVRHRQLLMPAAAAGCGLLWWFSRHSQSPYVTAKALVIGAPLIMALGLRALLTTRQASRSTRAVVLAIAGLFCGFAAYSSYQELRNEPVQAPEAGSELASFHHTIGTSAVLFLGDDDYAPWQLRDAAVTALSRNTPSQGEAEARRAKPWLFGEPLDFDSVNPADLDRFRFVITSNSPYASQVPPNFTLIAARTLYSLWERTGPTISRQVIEPRGAPGAILSCNSPFGRRLRVSRGYAALMALPISVVGVALLPGASAEVPLPLPSGKWAVSVQYVSTFDVKLSAQGKTWKMPAYLGRLGPVFDVGEVGGRGTSAPVTLKVSTDRPSSLTGLGGNLFTNIPTIFATRIPDVRRIVPLSQACGQYVDWYRLS